LNAGGAYVAAYSDCCGSPDASDPLSNARSCSSHCLRNYQTAISRHLDAALPQIWENGTPPPTWSFMCVSLAPVAYASGSAGGGGSSVSPRRVVPVVTSFPGPVTMRPLSADRGPVASRREQLARDTLRHLGATTLGDASYSGTYGAQVCYPCRGLFPPGTTPSRCMCSHRSVARTSTFCGVRGVAWKSPVSSPMFLVHDCLLSASSYVLAGCPVLAYYVLHCCWSRMVAVQACTQACLL
jgi:hypothetical protein